jgi:hypothetical protein
MSSSQSANAEQNELSDSPLNEQPSSSSNQPPNPQQQSVLRRIDPSMTSNINAYAIIHNNRIYAIYRDSDLGREYEQLPTKEERREFLKTRGEKRP